MKRVTLEHYNYEEENLKNDGSQKEHCEQNNYEKETSEKRQF